MEPGTVINQYKVISAIGKGGMGEVYKAYDSRLDREVAIKALPSDMSGDEDRLRRFEPATCHARGSEASLARVSYRLAALEVAV